VAPGGCSAAMTRRHCVAGSSGAGGGGQLVATNLSTRAIIEYLQSWLGMLRGAVDGAVLCWSQSLSGNEWSCLTHTLLS
jgi:hypothetical protein